MIKGHPDWWEARERLQGWREAMRQNGLTINESLIVPGDWSAEIGEKQMAALLQRHPEIDGVFVANDSMAVGGLKAARQLGRKVPDDLAVIGFDDVPEAAYFYPALTTIRQNLDCLGSRAVTELNKLIDSNKSERSLPTEPILIEPELIVRESS
jgi:LacI family transcriptional regulator